MMSPGIEQNHQYQNRSPKDAAARALIKKHGGAGEVVGPGDFIGEGDSRLILDALSAIRGSDDDDGDGKYDESIFDRLNAEVQWQTMSHAGGEVPRLLCAQGTFGEDGSTPVYRHPADQTLLLLSWTPTALAIKAEVEKLVGHEMNHCLVQLYRHGDDFISEHSDKTLDIVKGSSIVNVSLGAERSMKLRTKKSAKKSEDEQRRLQLIPLPNESVFIMGLETNRAWLHGITKADKKPTKKPVENDRFGGARISLTFRNIGTFLNADNTRIWGQGARKESNVVINADDVETKKLINMFGFENHSTEFDWDETYGRGSNVLHFS